MLQNAYFLAKSGADTAEYEQHFAEICRDLHFAECGLVRSDFDQTRVDEPLHLLKLLHMSLVVDMALSLATLTKISVWQGSRRESGSSASLLIEKGGVTGENDQSRLRLLTY